jgi:hypothetical protein
MQPGPHPIYFSTGLPAVIHNAVAWFDQHLS